MCNLELGENLTEDQWNNYFVLCLRYTTAVKLRYFQYRLINRILTTNVRRSKWANAYSKCTFCKITPETVIHLLCECPCVKVLWKTLETWCKYYFQINLMCTNIIICNNYEGKYKKLVNLMILVLKQYIY